MAKQKSTPAASAPESTPVRALVTVHLEGEVYPPDSVLDLTADQFKALTEAGSVDPHPDAVAYARSLKV